MKTKIKSFVLHLDLNEAVQGLTDEQAGKLLKAMYKFNLDQEVELDPFTGLVFTFFKAQFIRDKEKYQQTCERLAEYKESKAENEEDHRTLSEKRAEAGRLGGMKKAENFKTRRKVLSEKRAEAGRLGGLKKAENLKKQKDLFEKIDEFANQEKSEKTEYFNDFARKTPSKASYSKIEIASKNDEKKGFLLEDFVNNENSKKGDEASTEKGSGENQNFKTDNFFNTLAPSMYSKSNSKSNSKSKSKSKRTNSFNKELEKEKKEKELFAKPFFQEQKSMIDESPNTSDKTQVRNVSTGLTKEQEERNDQIMKEWLSRPENKNSLWLDD